MKVEIWLGISFVWSQDNSVGIASDQATGWTIRVCSTDWGNGVFSSPNDQNGSGHNLHYYSMGTGVNRPEHEVVHTPASGHKLRMSGNIPPLSLYTLTVYFCCDSPQWATASSITRFLDHTQRRTTVSGTPLDE